MIIVGSQTGQLCNNLFVFAHLLANAMEHNYVICNPAFCRYAHHFKATKYSLTSAYPQSKFRFKYPFMLRKKLYRIINKLSRYGNVNTYSIIPVKTLDISQTHDAVGSNYDLENAVFIKLRHETPILIISGWLFRDHDSLGKHGDKVRHFFEPLNQYGEAVREIVRVARVDCDVLVGVHIRQGDYRDYSNGRYYYDTSEYVAIMRKVMGLWGDRRVKYLICSDQIHDETCFDDVPHTMGSHEVIEDLYAFAKCDYLIGPPSTFTQWASFYGKVPLCIIDHPQKILSIDQFCVWKG